jgi:subtilisin family serine protease
VPGGVPGVVDVSSTENIVAPSSATCAPDKIGSATIAEAVCKPTSDAHQAGGQGSENQLAYYSNYGSRIDVAGPGGARKFNLPTWDRGGTGGFPMTDADLTTAFGDFNITSDWALAIQCFTFTGGGFPPDQCYTILQGTSQATPHASAVVALIASHTSRATHNPDLLISMLKRTATHLHGNETQVLSATDVSPGDRTGVACPSGYCHLGGPAVSDKDAYGDGLVNAERAVRNQ